MKKLNYYTAIEEITNEDGRKCRLRVSAGKEDNFTSEFKTIEETKRAINRIYTARQRKDMTRTYADGSKRRLSFNDVNDIRYIIRKHYEEVEEIEVTEHPRTFDETETAVEEELSI